MSTCGTKPTLDPSLHRDKKPDWIKVKLPKDPAFWSTKSLVTDLKLVTVCEEAQCPNRWECWSHGTATFMIAGEKCTRACGFCACWRISGLCYIPRPSRGPVCPGEIWLRFT